MARIITKLQLTVGFASLTFHDLQAEGPGVARGTHSVHQFQV